MANKYRYRTRPYRHQVPALRKLLKNGYGGALLMDPRTGKSKVVIDWASILFKQDKLDRIMIVCPSKVLELQVWQEEWATHCPYPRDIYIWDRKARNNGGLPEPNPGRLLVVLINYEAFSTPGRRLPSGARSTKTGRIKIRNEIRRWATNKAAMVLDESHHIKSVGAAVHRVIVSLYSSFLFRVIMTGTVVTKQARPHDVYAQWKFLNPSRIARWEDVTDFKTYFGVWRKPTKTVPVPVFIKPREDRLNELHALMMADGYSVARDECFDLPPADIQIIPVQLSRSARIYDDMATKMVAEFRQYTAEASITLVKLLRLAQITGGFVTTDRKEIVKVGNEKLDALKDHLKDFLENGERLAVVARFKPELDALIKLGKSFKVPVFTIRGQQASRQQLIDFQRARKLDEPFIYVLQPHAAAEGIDLAFLSRMVWYSLTPSFVKYTQCCDRIALNRRSTTFTYLLTDGIDKLLYETLQGDGQFLDAVRRRPERLLRNELS